MKFAHTNIVSTDWRKLAAFYVNTFGCKILEPTRQYSGEWLDKGLGLQKAKMTGVHLQLPGYGADGPTLEIYQYEDFEPQEHLMPNKRGFGHIAFEVDDVKKVLEKLIANGGSTCGEITTRFVEGMGSLTFIYARDPEGNIIELQSWKK